MNISLKESIFAWRASKNVWEIPFAHVWAVSHSHGPVEGWMEGEGVAGRSQKWKKWRKNIRKIVGEKSKARKRSRKRLGKNKYGKESILLFFWKYLGMKHVHRSILYPIWSHFAPTLVALEKDTNSSEKPPKKELRNRRKRGINLQCTRRERDFECCLSTGLWKAKKTTGD